MMAVLILKLSVSYWNARERQVILSMGFLVSGLFWFCLVLWLGVLGGNGAFGFCKK